MTRGNSASGNGLGRRRFLGGFFGLGTGATVFGAVPTDLSTGRKARLGANSTAQPMREYERRLARTERMEVLGYPRDWSVVRDGLHPFHPQRIAIMPSGTRLNYGNRCGQQLRKKIDEEIEKYQSSMPGGPAPLPQEKLESIYWIMALMTGHYRVPELFESWVLGLAGREILGSSVLGNQFGLVHQFQRGGDIKVDCTPIDWWLFLFPAGIDWESLDEQPVHALVGHVCRSPFRDTWGESEYPAWCLTGSLMGRLDDWRSISRMGRIDAARHLNEITVRLLDEVKT